MHFAYFTALDAIFYTTLTANLKRYLVVQNFSGALSIGHTSFNLSYPGKRLFNRFERFRPAPVKNHARMGSLPYETKTVWMGEQNLPEYFFT